MYRYYGFCILPVDLVYELVSPWSHDPRTQLNPRMPAVSVLKCTTETALPGHVLILFNVSILPSKHSAMCKRRSSLFTSNFSPFFQHVVYVCLFGKGMVAAQSMWRASFSFNAMCIMQ